MASDTIIGAGLCASPYFALHDQCAELAMRNRELREENERLSWRAAHYIGPTCDGHMVRDGHGMKYEPICERLRRDLAAAREALRELLSCSVVLSDEYLAKYDSYPDDATLQGWSKGRWKLISAAAKKARDILAAAPAEEPRQQDPALPHKQCRTSDDCRREQLCMDAWHCASAAAPAKDAP